MIDLSKSKKELMIYNAKLLSDNKQLIEKLTKMSNEIESNNKKNNLNHAAEETNAKLMQTIKELNNNLHENNKTINLLKTQLQDSQTSEKQIRSELVSKLEAESIIKKNNDELNNLGSLGELDELDVNNMFVSTNKLTKPKLKDITNTFNYGTPVASGLEYGEEDEE
jgi:chromosome segregation ATPase